jgi:thermitase
MPSYINLVFLVTFASLSLWLLFKDNKEIRKYFGTAFAVSFLFYSAFHILSPWPFGLIKFLIGIIILFVGGFTLNIFSSNKILFVLLLAAALIGIWQMPSFPGIPFWGNVKLSNTKDIDPNFELLVEMKPGKTSKSIEEILKKYKLQFEPAFELKSGDITDLDDYIAVNIPNDQLKNFDSIIQALKNSGQVDAIEQNEIVTLYEPQKSSKQTKGYGSAVLNDPLLDKVWTTEILQLDALHLLLSEKKIKARKKAKIAIIDTGVEANHQDLNANFISTRVEYDEDPQGHGTHCAGIAAAVSNNKKGIASFAPSNEFVEITSIQVFSRTGGTTQRNIIRAIILAVDNGTDVISMSLGGPSNDAAQIAYREAVEYASKKGAIIVAAAGNEDSDASKKVPASVKGVIAVAATDENNQKASFSNDVSQIKMAVAAPGVNIYSTLPDSKYGFMSGTSMATPYVAGLIGLMKAIDPTLNTEKAFKILEKTGKKTKSSKETGNLIQPMSAIVDLLK